MGVDALAPYVARSSTTKVLTKEDNQDLVIHRKGFQVLHYLNVEKL